MQESPKITLTGNAATMVRQTALPIDVNPHVLVTSLPDYTWQSITIPAQILFDVISENYHRDTSLLRRESRAQRNQLLDALLLETTMMQLPALKQQYYDALGHAPETEENLRRTVRIAQQVEERAETLLGIRMFVNLCIEHQIPISHQQVTELLDRVHDNSPELQLEELRFSLQQLIPDYPTSSFPTIS